jgi:hypothetical protein
LISLILTTNHLDRQPALLSQRDDTLPLGPVRAGRLVVPDVLAGQRDLLGLVEALVVAALGRDGDDRRVLKQLARVVEPAQALVGLPACSSSQRRARAGSMMPASSTRGLRRSASSLPAA